jgi:hypothetical protein
LSRRPCKVCAKQKELSKGFDDDDPDNTSAQITDGEVRATTRDAAAKQADDGMTQPIVILDGWDNIDIHNDQLQDTDIGSLLVIKSSGADRPGWSHVSPGTSALKTLWRQWERLEIRTGILYRKFTDGDGAVRWQLIVPKKKQKEVIHYHHDIPSAGHLGYEKTLARIQQSLYWPAMTDSIKAYCRKCDICTVRRLSKKQSSFKKLCRRRTNGKGCHGHFGSLTYFKNW